MQNQHSSTTPTLHTEDRRFFLAQYLRTMPLNLLSIAVSAVTWALWVLLDNARLLGFFSLASITSSFCQQSMLVGALAQAILPNSEDRTHEKAIVQTAWRVDTLIIFFMILATLAFFFFSRADIVTNLGIPFFLLTGMFSLVEPLPGVAIHVCNARRLYGWTFIINNCRGLTVIICLLALLVHTRQALRAGIGIWVAAVAVALCVSLLFFYRRRINPFGRSPKSLTQGFLQNIHQIFLSLAVYRIAVLLFAGLPSLLIAFIHTPKEIGLFSFALSLTGFLYSAIAPINEQVYSPTFSKLVHQQQSRLLVRRIFQMMGITFIIAIPCSALLFWSGIPILQALHKTAFIESFILLPALLSYRVLMMAIGGFTYSLFCMNRFKALSCFYLISAAVAGLWYAAFKASFVRAVWCLPISVLCMGVLSAAYVLWLTIQGRSLLRRSMYNVMPEESLIPNT